MSLRVLLIHDECVMGGHTSFMLGLARGLRDRGHRVLSYFFRDGGFLPQYARQALAARGEPATLRELLRSEPFDVVHGDSCMQDLPGILRRAGYRGRIVLTRHSWNAPPGWHSRLCDALVAVSPSSAELIRPLTDLPVDCIPNGVDTDFFQPVAEGEAPPRPVIAWCGRSGDPVKNFGRYLSVTWKLPQDRYDFRVADGDPPEDLEAFRRQVGAHHVSSWDRYDRNALRSFFSEVARSGGCLLATSRCETLGLALLEAMACGCPVIGARVPGTRDVLSGELRRWTYAPESSDEEVAGFIEDALLRFQEPGVREAFRSHVMVRFSQQSMVDAYVALYRRVLRMERPAATEIDRAATARRLWDAARAMAKDGRPRDALFAARGAARLDPLSVFGSDRSALLLRSASASRRRGADFFLERARAGFADHRYLQSARELMHAMLLHPGALLRQGRRARP